MAKAAPKKEEKEVKALAKKAEVQVALASQEEAEDFDGGQVEEFDPADLLTNANAAALAALDAVSEADDDDFVETKSTLWKPTEKGESLIGIKLGVINTGRYKHYVIGCVDKESGEKYTMQVNRTKVLKKQLDPIPPMTGIKLVFEGEVDSGKGQPTRLFKVSRLKSK